MSSAAPPNTSGWSIGGGSLLAACALPSLIAFNLPPSPTLFNQAAALGLWGLALVVLAPIWTGNAGLAARHSAALLAALLLLALAALLSIEFGALPFALGSSAAGLLLATLALVLGGAALRPAPLVMAAYFGAWVVAG